MSVLFSKPGGGITAAGLTSGVGVSRIYTGDFNGDGKLDLFVVKSQDEKVGVLLGNGDGTFTAAPVLSAPTRSVPALGDFNGDGKLDVIVAIDDGGATARMAFLAGNGEGTFQMPRIFAAPGTFLVCFVAGDFNNDGKLDLAIISDGTLRILPGNGDGTFQAATPPIFTRFAGYDLMMDAPDVDNDGHTDLITEGIRIFLGKGDFTFRTPQTYDRGFNMSSSFSVADLNGDGIRDLIYTSNGAVGVLLGKGDRTFYPKRFYAAGNGFILAVPIDFNADGKADLAVAGSETVTLLINTTGTGAIE